MAETRVALFVTCLVDLFRPSVGFAALELLERGGATVSVPDGQTCCGQPAYNSGDRETAVALARRMIALFEPFDYVVAPSGSCAAMLRHHYPGLFAGDPAMAERAEAVAAKTWELTAFMVDVLGIAAVDSIVEARATYHDACSGLRELGVRRQPRELLATVAGLELVELAEPESCCGFGGTFCVKYPEISTKMVEDKAADIEATGADLVLAGDLGCLLNIAGHLRRRGARVAVRHVAEVLAGRLDAPPIAAPRGSGR